MTTTNEPERPADVGEHGEHLAVSPGAPKEFPDATHDDEHHHDDEATGDNDTERAPWKETGEHPGHPEVAGQPDPAG